MSFRVPDRSPLSDNGYLNEVPMAGGGEVALHELMQHVYARTVKVHNVQRFMRPTEVMFSGTTSATIARWPIRFTADHPNLACVIHAWCAGAVPLLYARLLSYTFATPPVLIATGTYDYQSAAAPVRVSAPDFMARGILPGSWNVTAVPLLATSLATTRNQIIALEMGNPVGAQERRIYLQHVELRELALGEL